MIQRTQYTSGICECHNHDEMMGQSLCFSFCCLFVHMCVCVFDFDHTQECVLHQCRQWVGVFTMFMCGYCVWTEWSLYSRHVVYSLPNDSLLPASVVYLYSLVEVWLTPHNWPTRIDQIWPDLTTPLKINQRQPDWTKWREAIPCYKKHPSQQHVYGCKHCQCTNQEHW